MADPDDRTRTRAHPPAQPPPAAAPKAGVDLSTLIITAIASACAAYACSKVWTPGTLASAAFTPVIVAILKEVLRRPTEVVTAAVPVPPVRARRRADGTLARAEPGRTTALPDDLTERLQDGTPVASPPPSEADRTGPVRYHKAVPKRRLRWRIAVLSGLLGFAVCVVFYTVPELLSGHAAGNSGRRTTLFSGSHHKHSKHKDKTTTTQTVTTVERQQTTTVVAPTQTVTTPPPVTVTVPPATTTTPPSTAPPDDTQSTGTTPAP